MEDIAADLGAPFDLFLGGIGDVLGLLASAQFFFVEAAFEHLQGLFAVLSLGAGLLAFDDDAAGDMFEANGCFHFIDVLAALAAAAVELPFQVRGTYLDLDAVVDQRVDEDGGEGSMATGVGIKG
jgi:hypothetical protein